MTVQDLINALEDQPKGCEVTVLLWPSQGASAGYVNHVGVTEVATLRAADGNCVVLRLANSL